MSALKAEIEKVPNALLLPLQGGGGWDGETINKTPSKSPAYQVEI